MSDRRSVLFVRSQFHLFLKISPIVFYDIAVSTGFRRANRRRLRRLRYFASFAFFRISLGSDFVDADADLAVGFLEGEGDASRNAYAVALEGFSLTHTVDIRPSASRKTIPFTPGFQNASAELVSWLELSKHRTKPTSLNGFHLNSGYDNPTSRNLPESAAILPSKYQIIRLAGEPEETTVGDLHANFKLSAEKNP